MVKRIVIHVEGGGNATTKANLRQAFKIFFRTLIEQAEAKGVEFDIIFEGSRLETYKRFRYRAETDKMALHLLLVDSEAPVRELDKPWQHLKKREGDGWERPSGVSDEQCHFMAQAMEAWFFADPDALATYYGQNFQRSSLPTTSNVEQIPKDDHIPKLEAATRNTTKGAYHKTRHAPSILERLDAKKVQQRAPHCERLFAIITAHIEAHQG